MSFRSRLYSSVGTVDLMPAGGAGNYYAWFDRVADSTRWASTLMHRASGAGSATVVCDSWRGDPRGLGGPGGNAWMWPIAIR